jgi:hypothetical protein
MSGNIGSISGRGQQGSYQVGESDQYGDVNNLLTQLHTRVSDTLAGRLDGQMAEAAQASVQAVNPQEVLSAMSELSIQHGGKALPGMTCGALA